jgi:hypothetical protein
VHQEWRLRSDDPCPPHSKMKASRSSHPLSLPSGSGLQ